LAKAFESLSSGSSPVAYYGLLSVPAQVVIVLHQSRSRQPAKSFATH